MKKQLKFEVYVVGSNKETKTDFEIDSDKKLSDLASTICNSKISKIERYVELTDITQFYRFTNCLRNPTSTNPKNINYDKGDKPMRILFAFPFRQTRMLFQFNSLITIMVTRKWNYSKREL